MIIKMSVSTKVTQVQSKIYLLVVPTMYFNWRVGKAGLAAKRWEEKDAADSVDRAPHSPDFHSPRRYTQLRVWTWEDIEHSVT